MTCALCGEPEHCDYDLSVTRCPIVQIVVFQPVYLRDLGGLYASERI